MSDLTLRPRPASWHARLADTLLGWRDRLLASERFQRWAVAFPLTRPIARRRSRALFDIVAGFVYSQVLLACVRLGLFEMLRAGPLPAASLAHRLRLTQPAALRLLLAAASLGLLQRRSDCRFGLGPHGAALLGNPSVCAMIEHHALLYADMRDPVALLRGEQSTTLSGYWPYAGTADPGALGDGDVAAYSALMAATQQFIAGEVLDAYPIARHRHLLDVGGGEGAFLAAAAARAPQLRITLFDLPAVAARAQARFARLGLAARAQAVGGSFLTDSLPTGADIVSIVRVLHDHEDHVVHTILAAAYAALPPGGTLLVAEPMAGTEGAEPVGDAYFGFYLLAMGTGRAREAAELTEMLTSAGFTAIRQVPTHSPLLTRLLLARKPG